MNYKNLFLNDGELPIARYRGCKVKHCTAVKIIPKSIRKLPKYDFSEHQDSVESTPTVTPVSTKSKTKK